MNWRTRLLCYRSWIWPTVPNLHFWFTTVKVKGNDSTINKRLFSYCRSKTWFFLTDSRIRKKCLKTLQLFIVFNALMTVASNKTSSSDCNLSTKALKNSSRKNHVWILDCRSRFVQPEVAVRIPLSSHEIKRYCLSKTVDEQPLNRSHVGNSDSMPHWEKVNVFYIAMAEKSGKKTAIPDGPASGMAVFY